MESSSIAFNLTHSNSNHEPNLNNDQDDHRTPEMTIKDEQSSTIDTNKNVFDNTHVVERNIKQIHIREESTVRKVLKTREITHYDASGNVILPPTIPQNDQTFSDRQISHEQEIKNRSIDENLSSQNLNDAPSTNSKPNISPNQHAQEYGLNDSPHQTNNYQNLFIDSNVNIPPPISAQLEPTRPTSQASISQPVHIIQPIQRTSIRNMNVHPSGYQELDSTLNYSPHQAQVRSPANDPNSSIYASKNSILVHPINANSGIMVQPDANINSNGILYVNQKSNYDIAYGSTIPTVSSNSNIYGTRVVQEPHYGTKRNGPVAFLAQSNTTQNLSEVRWRDPELEEVIGFLSSADPIVRANSVAYLQHLTFADDHMKERTRLLGGITLLIDLLNRDILEVQRNVCGALRNLSYGRKNDDNKRAIRDAQGIQAIVRTLINNQDNEIREVATSVLWNLSSCEEIKWSIIDLVLIPLVSVILVPYTSWFKANLNNSQQFLPTTSESHWSTVFKNATGVLRNISSAGAHARKQLRDCDGLVSSLFFIISTSISRNDLENKLVENCVCILRNLSYRCQETQDPDYDKHYYSQNSSQTDSITNSNQNSPSSPSSSANLTTSLVEQVSSKVTDNIGCFSFGKRTKSKSKSSLISNRNNPSIAQNESSNLINHNRSTLLPPHHPSNLQTGIQNTMVRTSTQIDGFNNPSTLPPSGISNIVGNVSEPQGKELLWQPDVVKPYLALLSGCSNSETLEAAAGAIQNLAACYWQPSIEIRAAVRKERGLPVLVELLRMDRDSVVCVVATALRNLAIDQKNKELIGKYAMLDLVNKLTTDQSDQESPSSDDTIAAVLATLHEVISNNVDFVRSFYEVGGLIKLNFITKNRSKFSSRVQRFSAQVLLDMWKFTELRDLYRKGGWKESHFIIRQGLNIKNSSYSVNSNTIERPMASQQADRSSSLRNLRTISAPIPQQSMSQLNLNPTNQSVLDQSIHFEQTQGSGLNSVPMTYLTNQIDNVDGPQAVYAQVDRQRKRNDLTRQQQQIDC